MGRKYCARQFFFCAILAPRIAVHETNSFKSQEVEFYLTTAVGVEQESGS
jgi:hypothetical protein